MTKILRYMTSYSERENLPLRTYFDRASWKYPILYQVYKDLFVDVVTSASVEQLFAEHWNFAHTSKQSVR